MKLISRDVRFLQVQEQILNEPGSKEEALLYFYFIEISLSHVSGMNSFPESM